MNWTIWYFDKCNARHVDCVKAESAIQAIQEVDGRVYRLELPAKEHRLELLAKEQEEIGGPE